MQLFAFVKRKEGMSREDFLNYWRNQHGPLIRDTPGLGDRTIRYEQHAARADDQSGWDGVAVQEFADWDDFIAMLGGEAGDAMRADEGNFLDAASIKVVFTDDRVVIIGPDARSSPGVATGDVSAEADIEALTEARPDTGQGS